MWFMPLTIYFGVSRFTRAKASSNPNMMLLPPYAENVAKFMEAALTHVHQRSRQRICNPFVHLEAKEGKEDNIDHSMS